MNAQETIDLMRVMLDAATAFNAGSISQAQYERIMAAGAMLASPMFTRSVTGSALNPATTHE